MPPPWACPLLPSPLVTLLTPALPGIAADARRAARQFIVRGRTTGEGERDGRGGAGIVARKIRRRLEPRRRKPALPPGPAALAARAAGAGRADVAVDVAVGDGDAVGFGFAVVVVVK